MSGDFQAIIFKSCGLFVLIGVTLWLSSCSNDSEPNDSVLPQASILDLTDAMNVWDIVPVKIEATDDNEIATIDVFVDDNLLATFTEGPYEMEWDSNTVPDGEHTVTVVVADASGNKIEKHVTLVVKNVLVTINIPQNQLQNTYAERGFIFLSDETGGVIAATEYTNGQHLELRSPGFNGEKFYLTEVVYNENEYWGPTQKLRSYADIQRGDEWTVSDLYTGDEPPAELATVNWTNIKPSGQYIASTNGGSAYVSVAQTYSILGLNRSPSKLYVAWESDEDEGGQYGLYSDVVAGENNFDLSLVNQPLTKVTFNAPANLDWGLAFVLGYPSPNDYSEEYTLQSTGISTDVYNIYYPGSEFSSYSTLIVYDVADDYYARRSRGIENFALPAYSGDVAFENNVLTYSMTGSFDFVIIEFGNMDTFSSWVLRFPVGTDLNVPSFEVPAMLEDFDFPRMGTPRYLGAMDFEGINNYDELIAFVRTDGYDGLDKNQRNYLFFDHTVDQGDTGGRKRQPIQRHPNWLR
jgi:hypothetical protein